MRRMGGGGVVKSQGIRRTRCALQRRRFLGDRASRGGGKIKRQNKIKSKGSKPQSAKAPKRQAQERRLTHNARRLPEVDTVPEARPPLSRPT